MIYFSADTHFDRETKFVTEQRNFACVEDMNAKMVAGFQRRLTDEDDLYFLGDLSHKTHDQVRAKRWFDEIPGRKHLISGNHDTEAVKGLPWASVQDYLEITLGGRLIVMFHYPMITWNQARAGSLHLFGHVHGNWPGSNKAVNVGVDFWDFAPCTLPEIEARALTLAEPPFWETIEPNA